ncbi:MAG: LacI family transcriptional regulator, partial [Lentisphaerae bacterium]
MKRQGRKNKPVTTIDIARHCGLSRQTVSFILNGHCDLFRPETVELVHKAARELGYRPFLAMKSMRTGKTQAVAMLQ